MSDFIEIEDNNEKVFLNKDHITWVSSIYNKQHDNFSCWKFDIAFIEIEGVWDFCFESKFKAQEALQKIVGAK